jgi:hypothetical protein
MHSYRKKHICYGKCLRSAVISKKIDVKDARLLPGDEIQPQVDGMRKADITGKLLPARIKKGKIK